MVLRIGSLCTGIGALDKAVSALTGGRVIWYSEIDPNARIVLRTRLPRTRNIGDMTRVDWATVRPIDILTAGYPCQPFSSAGFGDGSNDSRDRWPDVRRAVRALRPRYVFLENVTGHLNNGFRAVLGDLAEDGYDATWHCVSASDSIGAVHKRERLFVIAYPDGARRVT